MRKKRILFLCTGNSCRSQMAEGWARRLKAQEFEAFSAGLEPKGLDPRAVQVMKEAGVDITSQRSKAIEELEEMEFDYVITLCDHAQQTCPAFPAKVRVIHRAFPDPPALAHSARTEQEALEHYRRVRDEIKEFVQGLPDTLEH